MGSNFRAAQWPLIIIVKALKGSHWTKPHHFCNYGLKVSAFEHNISGAAHCGISLELFPIWRHQWFSIVRYTYWPDDCEVWWWVESVLEGTPLSNLRSICCLAALKDTALPSSELRLLSVPVHACTSHGHGQGIICETNKDIICRSGWFSGWFRPKPRKIISPNTPYTEVVTSYNGVSDQHSENESLRRVSINKTTFS